MKTILIVLLVLATAINCSENWSAIDTGVHPMYGTK